MDDMFVILLLLNITAVSDNGNSCDTSHNIFHSITAVCLNTV